MKIRIAPSLLFLIMFIGLVFPLVNVAPKSDVDRRVDLAVKFLVNRYNATVGLVQQSPNYQPNIYWIVSDGLYAYYALKPHLPDIADKIWDGMVGIHGDGFHESFWKSVPWPVPWVRMDKCGVGGCGTNLFNISTAEIWMNFFDNRSFVINDDNMWNWADFMCVKALNYYHSGRSYEARMVFDEMMENTWNGVGINDTATMDLNAYWIYKLAFVMVTANIIHANLPDRSLMESILWEAQVLDEDNPSTWESWNINRLGGLYGAYTTSGTFEYYTDVACEPTSLAIIYENTKPLSADWAYHLITFNDIAMIGMILAILAVFAMVVRRR